MSDGIGTTIIGAATVTTTATLIRAATQARHSIIMQNRGSVDVYIGTSSAVTTATGIGLAPGYEREFLGANAFYGVVASGTADVRWVEEVGAT